MFAILCVVVFGASWLLHRVQGLPTMPVEDFLVHGMMILLLAFSLVGWILARLGVQLVQEVLAERRGKDEERRRRAAQRYEQALEGKPSDDGESGGGPGGEELEGAAP